MQEVKGKLAKLFILIVVFGLSAGEGISFAQDVAEEESQKPKDIFNMVIPSDWGRVRDVYKGSKGQKQVIVHIQDAHCNYDAQTNIGNILNKLVEEYGLSIAGIEGATGKLETEEFSSFPEDDIRYQAADYFVRQGKMSGAEALVISRGVEYPLELYGIEDGVLYLDNFKAYQTSLPFKNEAKVFFINLKYALTRLKMFLYNTDLLEFDVQKNEFEKKVLSLNDYIIFLSGEMAKYNINKTGYENLSRLIKVNKTEDKIDFAKAEEERTKLLTELTGILSEDDIKALLDQGVDYRNGNITAARYLEFVRELAQNNEMNLEDYKNLDQYIDYSETYDKINSALLFDEIWQIEDAIKTNLYTDDEQAKLDLLIRGMETMERLVDIKMVNRDLSFYQEHSDEFKTDSYYTFITKQVERFKLDINLPSDISYLDVYIPAWVNFYKVAGKRDEAMIDNTIKVMVEKDRKIMAMVTGGFHTRELTRIMRDRDVSYIVVTPHIKSNEGNRYFDLLTGGKTDLENFVEAMSEEVTLKE
ncbi:MAG: hypothetical protein GY853_03695 [PVC group bacterium]|nr:hypothetical protein [PVC group bacterium]